MLSIYIENEKICFEFKDYFTQISKSKEYYDRETVNEIIKTLKKLVKNENTDSRPKSS